LGKVRRILPATSLPATKILTMRQRSQQNGASSRLICMVSRALLLRGLLLLCVAVLAFAAPRDAAIAKRLADRAILARDNGDVVRAYLLYNEAAKRDPSTPAYAASRDGLAATANLLMKTQLDEPVLAADIAAIEKEETDAEKAANPSPPGWEETELSLESFPHVHPKDIRRDFDIRGDELSLIQQVVSAYGVRAAWDPELNSKTNLQMQITQADFRTAMEALTNVTNTFVFPISTNTLYFARDSEAKRSELEPMILLTVQLPESLTDKDLIDVANAVKGLLNLKQFGWDSLTRTVFIRDRVSKALTARSLLQALLLPKAQVEFEVEVLAMDTDTSYQWGISPPTSATFFSLAPFNLANLLTNGIGSFTTLFGLGGGASLVGLGVGNATLLASYSKSVGKVRYDAVITTTDGLPASAHWGEKYPIAQSLYTGFAQSNSANGTAGGSIYTPAPQVQQVDLGLELKITPHVKGEGSIGLDVECNYSSLGTIVLNTVPSIDERKFVGNVILREGEWAVIAGLDQDSVTKSRNGLAGLNGIPGINQLLSANMRDHSTSQTVVLIKPHVTRLPVSANISPQYLLGPARGFKVLL